MYGNASKLVKKTNDGKTLYVKSVPMQWALKKVPGDCTFETWITLEGRSVRVCNRLMNRRKDHKQYPALDQELPAVYTIGKLHRLMTYTGDNPFVNKPLTEIPRRPAKDGRPQWTTFFATEHWAALVDDDDWGLGVIHPDVVRFLGGFSGKPNTGGPNDDPTGYLAPVRQEILDHNIVYEYRYTLVLDSLSSSQGSLQAASKSCGPGLPLYEGPPALVVRERPDTGFPLKDCWRLKVELDDPQLFGPERCWQAKDAPTIFVRAAYRTTNKTAELFWETADKSGFRGEQSVKFAIVPDGKMRTYEVDLSLVGEVSRHDQAATVRSCRNGTARRDGGRGVHLDQEGID